MRYPEEIVETLTPLERKFGAQVGDRVVWIWRGSQPLYDGGTKVQRGDAGTVIATREFGLDFQNDEGLVCRFKIYPCFALVPDNTFVGLLTGLLTSPS